MSDELELRAIIAIVVDLLDAIAKKNDDEFRYRIDIEKGQKGIRYRFVAEETSDGHIFVSGTEDTIAEAVMTVRYRLEAACQEWSYEIP